MLFPAFRGFFADFPVSATVYCLFGLFRLSTASKRTFPVSANFKLCFPVSAIFSNFSGFPWLKYGIFRFPATSFFQFSADFLWLFQFSGTFLVPFRLSAKSIPSPLIWTKSLFQWSKSLDCGHFLYWVDRIKN